jgi:hypothetical protein
MEISIQVILLMGRKRGKVFVSMGMAVNIKVIGLKTSVKEKEE